MINLNVVKFIWESRVLYTSIMTWCLSMSKEKHDALLQNVVWLAFFGSPFPSASERAFFFTCRPFKIPKQKSWHLHFFFLLFLFWKLHETRLMGYSSSLMVGNGIKYDNCCHLRDIKSMCYVQLLDSMFRGHIFGVLLTVSVCRTVWWAPHQKHIELRFRVRELDFYPTDFTIW